MRPIRVCHLITELRPAGAERGLYDLVTRLDRARFDARVVALRGGEVADRLTRAGVPVTVLGVRGKWDVAALPRLVGVLRRIGPDVLHTHLFHADLAGRAAAWAAGVPRLMHTIWTAEGRFRPWQFAHARFFGELCDRLICLAPSVRDFHARRSGLPASAYTVIPWGIDAEAYRRDEAARRRLRAEWGIADDRVVVAYVGRLEFYKGIEVLLGAMSHLAARGHGLDLVIAGDGPRRHIVENWIAVGEGGCRARLLGFLPDVRGVLSAADLFVMPSLWEGWGLALGEAMAAGLAAVGTDVPAVRDLVVDGQTGLLVAPRDSVALAEAVYRLARGHAERRRMGDSARRRIVERFPLSATVAAHERLYERSVGPRL